MGSLIGVGLLVPHRIARDLFYSAFLSVCKGRAHGDKEAQAGGKAEGNGQPAQQNA
jgi:hypothetical protein